MWGHGDKLKDTQCMELYRTKTFDISLFVGRSKPSFLHTIGFVVKGGERQIDIFNWIDSILHEEKMNGPNF